MKYKNLVIKCNNVEELIKLQKHLFKYKYSWKENNARHRMIKKNEDISYVFIEHDDILQLFAYDPALPSGRLTLSIYKSADYISFEKKFERKEKLKKINNDI